MSKKSSTSVGQQSLFLDQLDPHHAFSNSKKEGTHFHLYVDGAARNNPGPAAAGMYLTREGEPVVAKGHYLGKKTNNQAEYLALVLGLMYAQKHMEPHDELSIFADSLLMVRQINGEYAVRNADLKPLHAIARQLLQPYKRSRMTHIYREHNGEADALANEGIDKKIAVPATMKDWLSKHGIIV